MYKTVLVNPLVRDGEKLLQELAHRRFRVSAAFWYFMPESMRWTLVIASPVADRKGPLEAYARVQEALASLQRSDLTLDEISVMGPREDDYQDLVEDLQTTSRTTATEVIRRGKDVTFEEAVEYTPLAHAS